MLSQFADVAAEARSFLGVHRSNAGSKRRSKAPTGSSGAARRLFAMAKPIECTLVETYLHVRGVATSHGLTAIRFHQRCYYRPDEHAPTKTWPAMIAAVTDLCGAITGVHRTWLAPDGLGKAPIDTPRRAMGGLLGHAVRFGAVGDVLAAGEGIETMLSLRCALPAMPMAAALSASHLAALDFPATLRRLYVARDADPAGDRAMAVLAQRAHAGGIEAIALSPRLGDFNEDLRAAGARALRATVRVQLAPRTFAASCCPATATAGMSSRVGQGRCPARFGARSMASELAATPAFRFGDLYAKRPGPATAPLGLFSAAPECPALCIARQNSPGFAMGR